MAKDMELDSDECGMADDNDALGDITMEAKDGTKVPVEIKASTKAQRAALRAKLAADTIKMSPMLDEAHPKGSAKLDLDVSVSDDLALVEDLEDTHKAMMDVATAPVSVRKEAEAIAQLVAEGKISEDDLDSLVVEGLDNAAKEYYMKYFSEAGKEGKSFAQELIQESAKAKVASEIEAHKVKVSRAYDLAYEMVDCGLCASDRAAITSQVKDIVAMDDNGFASLKKVVASHATTRVKTAGRVPQVGVFGGSESGASVEGDLTSELERALSHGKRRMF